MELTPAEQQILLQLARESIRHGLDTDMPLHLDMESFDDRLKQRGASFVTLYLENELKGCIGTLTPFRPLALDVAENAFNAAFRDPRFPPLTKDEYERLTVSISVLSQPIPLEFNDEADLLRQLRPGVDGLILSAAGRRGTFLPSVWRELPDPQQFLAHLKRKAGLPADYWSPDIQVERYTTFEFHDPPRS